MPRGIPHSRFLRWSETDQDKALEWMLYQACKCSKCGTDPSEWLDERKRPKDPPPYLIESALCYGCKAIADHEKSMNDIEQEHKADRDGLSITLVANGTAGSQRPPNGE